VEDPVGDGEEIIEEDPGEFNMLHTKSVLS
jgi:hypothetical protein